ncbi:hypothetical protein DUI87_32796 [Hirundo rustica rustica]|uniref:Peptidase M12B domain-containing protein n=1 Tax=Hirundo rustica rustica TaxID=333673 RepID=A0A3M0IVI9_HIRRU|nr:hypothetical protein DUI87_32796 [Hirundo rustica rustica]
MMPPNSIQQSGMSSQMGFIQINEDFIFIEPLNHTLAVTGHAHRVYRRKRSIDEKISEKPLSQNQYCGVVTDKRKSKTQKVSESGRGKRYSYKLPQEYNIETVVVADPAMVSYHGTDAARRFILTILNMADMYIGHHGEKMLESFCKWQHEEFGKKNDIHLEMSTSWGEDMTSVDAAILITRKDFCVHKDEPCDTVGIAYLSGMCSEKRKCIIAEDNGLNLAFTIAHEMGHNGHGTGTGGMVSAAAALRSGLNASLELWLSMGINHDNDHPSCADGVHIMSGEWIKGQNLGDVSWSQCSREDLERFLRSKASNCLVQTNPQSLNSVIIPSKLPGMTYTADEQCQILFGPTASFCQEMQHVICTGLWCKVESEKECKTKLDPPMDGTDCDSGKVLKESVMGPQCSIGYVKILLVLLACLPLGTGSAKFSVSDLHIRNMYTSGKLSLMMKFGCDGILGSLAREDHCGICNGNGKSCKVIKGDFNHTRGAGYVEALVIPAGARRIKVVEEKPAHSYLALRDARKQSINSDWKIEHSGTFNIAGTTVHYVRRGLWEKISAKGPTTSPLHLLVLLFHDQSYGLHYEYTIPLDPLPENQSSKVPQPLFMWTHSTWEDCDAVCGGGERKTTVSCTKIMNKNISLVDNKKCKYLTKPEPQIRKCNEQPCQTRAHGCNLDLQNIWGKLCSRMIALQMDDDRMDTMFKDMWERNPEQTSSLHTAAQKWDPNQSKGERLSGAKACFCPAL